MITKKYDNEKVIFNEGEATMSFLDSDRGFLLFFKNELDSLNKGNANIKVLDVGCGAGAKTKALKKMYPNFSFQGCDVSGSAIKKAKRNPSGVRFFKANVQNLPLRSNHYDVVIMNSVLDHTEKPDLSLRECYRVLKKRGVFLITDPIEADLTTIHGQLYRFELFRKIRRNRCGHLHAFSKKTLINIIEKAGFRVEKCIFDWFFFTQLVDVFYHSLLSLSGKGPEFTIRRYTLTSNSFAAKILKSLRGAVTFIENIESHLTRSLPLGFFAYVRATKK